MAYDFFLGKLRLPVAPERLSMKINGKNQVVTLINEGEVNILKKQGLSTFSFSALLPGMRYSFAQYDGGFQEPAYFLEQLEKMKNAPFQFIVSRALPNGRLLFHSNWKVTLEEYRVIEEAAHGFDTVVEISLKQYREFGAKTFEVKQDKIVAAPKRVDSPPQKQSHTVVKGDSLWNIAQKYLGDGSRYLEIYALNKEIIDSKNKGTGNTRYTIYPKQVFLLP